MVIAASRTKVAALPTRVERVSRTGLMSGADQEHHLQRDQRPAGNDGVLVRNPVLQRHRRDQREQHWPAALRITGRSQAGTNSLALR